MTLYVIIEAIVAILAGVFIAVRKKKAEGLTYGKLDKAGIVTNILLLVLYCGLAPLYMFLGMISYPDHSGFLGLLGWIVAIIVGSAALPCGIGLGLSVSLRKQGKSKQSFAVQFAGLAGIVLSVGMFFIFYDNLLTSLN